MAIKSLEQRKRQQTLLIVAIVIAVLAAGVLYFGFMGGISAPAPEVSISGVEILTQEKFKKIDLEADMFFLKEKIFSFFKGYGDLPVQKGETGRNNPFISY
jgi:hypothetical protein